MPTPQRRASDKDEFMSDRTRQIVILVFAIVAALAALSGFLFYLYELHIGAASVPASIQASFTNFIVLVLMSAGPFVAYLLQARRSDRNASRTQAAVKGVQDFVENGLREEIPRKTADIVRHEAEAVAHKLADELRSAASVGDKVQENTEAVQENTRVTEENTDARKEAP